MANSLYLLKIKLLYIEPDIWRRFVVPSDIKLNHLHDVIQIVMGWNDCHLHEFLLGSKCYTANPEFKEDGEKTSRYRLVNLIKEKGQTFGYLYDFGDDWLHEIILEDSEYQNQKLKSEVRCLDGARACPPEDVGGLPGYDGFCDTMKNPCSEGYDEFLDWYGEIFDSEKFDIATVNKRLKAYTQ